MINIKILSHAILISIWIITNFYWVSVLHTRSVYEFIWFWCSKSISNFFEFYYLGFLLNLMVLTPVVYLLLILNKKVKLFLLKRFKIIFFISLFLVFLNTFDFLLFDTRLYPFNIHSNETVYCEYFSFYSDNYLQSGGCDVPD